jgi:hypothetical protein
MISVAVNEARNSLKLLDALADEAPGVANEVSGADDETFARRRGKFDHVRESSITSGKPSRVVSELSWVVSEPCLVGPQTTVETALGHRSDPSRTPGFLTKPRYRRLPEGVDLHPVG